MGAAVLGLAAVAAGYGGALHPAGDSLAVFRVPLAAATGLVLLILRRPHRLVWPGLALVALALLPRLWALRPVEAAEPAGLAIYQKNLLWLVGDPRPLAADILARAPDIVTLQEVGARSRTLLAALHDSYPYQHVCPYRRVGGTAVLSRWPAVPGSALCGNGLTALRLDTPGGPVWAVSLHLRWPWPYPQARQVGQLAAVLRGLDGPKVIGGDFNAVAWSHTLARIAAASGTRRAGHEAATFALPYGGVGVGLDHVLASGARPGSIEVLDRLGSDHRGVLAWVTVAP